MSPGPWSNRLQHLDWKMDFSATNELSFLPVALSVVLISGLQRLLMVLNSLQSIYTRWTLSVGVRNLKLSFFSTCYDAHSSCHNLEITARDLFSVFSVQTMTICLFREVYSQVYQFSWWFPPIVFSSAFFAMCIFQNSIFNLSMCTKDQTVYECKGSQCFYLLALL